MLKLFFAVGLVAAVQVDETMEDLFQFWSAFRDPRTGVFCDSLQFGDTVICGGGNHLYSSAGTGMGLIAECVFAELGLLPKTDAERNALQTIETLATQWPRELFSGFWVHFTNRTFGVLSEFSTVDSAELAAGVLFAANYYGGEVEVAAQNLLFGTKWAAAIAQTGPTIYPVVNESTGEMSGSIRPFNEYYLVAYLAYLMDPTNPRVVSYFNTYFGSQGTPPGSGGFPVFKKYEHYTLLTDNEKTFMSSFIPQFCWFMAKSYQKDDFFVKLNSDWMKADMLFWNKSLTEDSEIWGQKVKGRVWGCGAGDSPTGYGVERIEGSPDLVFSAAIMAGFLGVADAATRKQINAQLQWLRDNRVCSYQARLPNGFAPHVLWRCSVKQPTWEASVADSIDFSTLVLGYAINFLPAGFYAQYAA